MFVFHGIKPHILIWSFLNFVGIVIETLTKAVATNEKYQQLENSVLSPRGQRRLHALLAASLFLLSIVSNMYFLIGMEAGHIFFTNGFGSWPFGTPIILFFCYCGSQTSIELKNFEIRNYY